MNPYPLQKTAILLHLALLLSLIARAGAASFVWTGEGHSEDWNDPANWSSSSYPGRDGDHDEAVVGRLPGGPAIARVSSPLTLSRLRIQEGSYVSGATLTVSTAFDWTGGELQTSLVVGPNAVLTMDGDDLKDLSGATTVLDLMGHTIVSGTGQIRLSSEASVINRGTMTLLGAAEFTGSRCCAEPSSYFENRGLLEIPAARVAFNNLLFRTSGEIRSAGGRLDLGLGEHVAFDGARFTGPGRTVVSGKLTANGSVAIDQLQTVELSEGGTLDGNVTMVSGGTFEWSGGEIAGALTIPNGGRCLISGPGLKALSAGSRRGILRIEGDATIVGEGELRFVGSQNESPRIENLGRFTIAAPATFTGDCCVSSNLFSNTGLLVIAAPDPGTVKLDGVYLENRGTVRLVSGTLALSLADYTQRDGETRLAGGSLASSTPLAILGGSLTGSGIIEAAVYNSALLHPDFDHGPLHIRGNYQQGATGRLLIGLAGTRPDSQFASLQVDGAAALAGTVTLELRNGFVPAPGQQFEVLQHGPRAGAFQEIQLPTLPLDRSAWTQESGSTMTYIVATATNSTVGSKVENGVFRAVLQTQPGRAHRVEFSADLNHWETLFTAHGTGESIQLAEPVPPGVPVRFYRAVPYSQALGMCIDFQVMAPGSNPAPRTFQGIEFKAFDSLLNPDPFIEIRKDAGFTGLYCDHRLEINLMGTCDSVTLLLMTTAAPATAIAFDASHSVLSSATMSGSQQVIETLQLTGPGITRIEIDAPAQETLLLQLCCGP